LDAEEKNQLQEARRQAGILEDFPNEPTELVSTVQPGEGRRVLSWIWYAVGSDEIANDLRGNLHTGIRVEWVKSRARAERWREEVILLEEEMRRVIQFCNWRSEWWKERSHISPSTDQLVVEGSIAYAQENETREHRMAAKLQALWSAVRARARNVLVDDSDQQPGDVIEVSACEEEGEQRD
jgi:hypothetical protein